MRFNKTFYKNHFNLLLTLQQRHHLRMPRYLQLNKQMPDFTNTQNTIYINWEMKPQTICQLQKNQNYPSIFQLSWNQNISNIANILELTEREDSWLLYQGGGGERRWPRRTRCLLLAFSILLFPKQEKACAWQSSLWKKLYSLIHCSH